MNTFELKINYQKNTAKNIELEKVIKLKRDEFNI